LSADITTHEGNSGRLLVTFSSAADYIDSWRVAPRGAKDAGEFPVTNADRYLVVSDGPEIELKEKGSRFVGQTFFVTDREQVQSVLTATRRRAHAATHHCSAFQLAPPQIGEKAYDDDGEPAGTAGAPILARIEGRALFATLVIVTRFYGGTKLGTGGLIRAYGAAAGLALDAADTREIVQTVPRVIRASWDDLGLLESALSRGQQEGSVLSIVRDFGETLVFRIEVAQSCAANTDRLLIDSLSGRLQISEE
jgi:uncharacterized YigZ family protein